MDASGARLLAARIAAGVRIGSTIELVRDEGDGLHAGDRGIVLSIDPTGSVMVEMERGFDCMIEPAAFRPLAA